MKEQHLVNPGKNYRRLSNGDVLSGKQVNELLALAKPATQAIILFDITETDEPVNIGRNWKRIKGMTYAK